MEFYVWENLSRADLISTLNTEITIGRNFVQILKDADGTYTLVLSGYPQPAEEPTE